MTITPEEIRILISWYRCLGAQERHDDKLLEKLRAELKKIENKEMK